MREISILADRGMADNGFYVATPTPGDYKLKGPYGEMGNTRRWILLNDGIDPENHLLDEINNLRKPFVDWRNDGHWRIRNVGTSVQVTATRKRGGTEYEIVQDTRRGGYGCGESDALLLAIAPFVLGDGTSSSRVRGNRQRKAERIWETRPEDLRSTRDYDYIVEPGIISFENQPPISEFSSLEFSWRESLDDVKIGRRCELGQDCAFFSTSVYVRNMKTGQVLQYQVITFNSWGYYFNRHEYARTPQSDFIGISDDVETVYGMRYLQVGQSRKLVLDYLPRLKLILSNTRGIQGSLSDWKILMIWVGSYVNGAARIVSRVSDVNLIATV